MDAYQDTTQPTIGSSHPDQRRSECASAAPTLADVAKWKDEAAIFLHDVRQQLNDILAVVDRNLTHESTARLNSAPVSHNANVNDDDRETLVNECGDDRISALKARLARKLHTFEETSEQSIQTTSAAEVGQ